MTSERIIVGVDGSPGARSALAWAVDECQLRGCALLVLHTIDPRREAAPAGSGYDAFAENLLSQHAAAASTRRPGVVVTTLISHGRPADVLVDLSARADMLVVGTRGNSGFTSTMLGSVSLQAAAHAHSPVAVVPEHFQRPGGKDGGRVVVGVAGGRAGLMALNFARDEALLRGAELQTVRADAEPAEALLDAAHHAQLLVVGCHHSDERWSTRLGPVPASILHRAPCPVVVVGAVTRHDARTPEYAMPGGRVE